MYREKNIINVQTVDLEHHEILVKLKYDIAIISFRLLQSRLV